MRPVTQPQERRSASPAQDRPGRPARPAEPGGKPAVEAPGAAGEDLPASGRSRDRETAPDPGEVRAPTAAPDPEGEAGRGHEGGDEETGRGNGRENGREEDEEDGQGNAEQHESRKAREAGDGDGAGRAATRQGAAGAGAGAAGRPAESSGLQVLGRALWPPRLTRSQLLAAALLFVLGLGLAIQVRATDEDGELRNARPEDLVRILSDLEEHTARLQDERAGLLAERSELESSSDQAEEARRQTERRTRELGVLAGTVAAEGEGIVLRMDDRLGVVEADMLLDAVQELRAAGAEAIQINQVRVVAETYFVDENGGVVVDGQRLRAPYELRAIGRPRDLEPALNIPGGVVQSLENLQVAVTVDRPEKVTVDALRAVDQPDYAQSSP